MNSLTTEVLIQQLSKPDAYPFPVDQVKVIQTHISILFFAADWVYKLKKNLSFDFLDFSTLELRRHFCEEEHRLNSRLSPDMYLGVVPIVRAPNGGLCVEGEGEALEYAVKMKCLPTEFLMDHILEMGGIDYSILNRLVNKISTFHQSLESTEEVRAYGSAQSVAQSVMGNFTILENFRQGEGWALSDAQYQFLKSKTENFLVDHRELFEKRVVDGRIKEGHGDLHAGNICMTDDDIMIYDCIEFSQAFRCTDVACDLAFFVMDLDKRGYREFSNYFIDKYVENQGENKDEFLVLIDFYKTYRALVRAKVEAVQSASTDQSLAARARHLDEARRYVRLALSYQLPEFLVILCGLPGSGKSWVSRRIAEPFEGVVLRTDVIRKQWVGRELQHQPGAAFEEGIYSAEITDQIYQKAAERASNHLDDKQMVVVDAGFALKKHRDIFTTLSHDKNAPFVVLQLNCSDELILEHMDKRKKDSEEVSDANYSVHKRMAGLFEEPSEISESQRLIWASGGDADILLSQLIDKVILNFD